MFASAGNNYLLAALSAEEFRRLREHLQHVSLPLRAVLYEAGGRLKHLYFPTSGIISLLQVMADGASAAIAVVGNEGVVGIPLFMGAGETTTSSAVVQSAGDAYRVKADVIEREFKRGGKLQHVLLRYTQSLIIQMSQSALCNRHHSVEQRLCRWLLMSVDRLPSNELVVTQELIAEMLGVRRQGVSEAAHKLQETGLIRYSRGRISILGRPKLEARACECYAFVKKETDRLLGGP